MIVSTCPVVIARMSLPDTCMGRNNICYCKQISGINILYFCYCFITVG